MSVSIRRTPPPASRTPTPATDDDWLEAATPQTENSAAGAGSSVDSDRRTCRDIAPTGIYLSKKELPSLAPSQSIVDLPGPWLASPAEHFCQSWEGDTRRAI